MVVAVQPDLVTAISDLLAQTRPAEHLAGDDEKGGMRLCGVEGVENGRRGVDVGAVIERDDGAAVRLDQL